MPAYAVVYFQFTNWAVASAVIVPEAEQQHSPTSPLGKRRQSSVAEEASKRAKLSEDASHTRDEQSSPPKPQDTLSERRKSGLLEERKRGQRLFGALLGTLSQSSSSAAQKRRTDIERKQQAKLKLQAEEYDEQKKQRLEALKAARRKEQKIYDKQSMQIRHSNLLAQAHYLQTKAEPILFFKPWELLPGDDDKIKSQVEEAEETIERERAQFESNLSDENPNLTQDKDSARFNPEEGGSEQKETVGSEINLPNEQRKSPSNNNTNVETNKNPTPNSVKQASNLQESSKEHEDDGGEMVEADEDMVIY
ncbi:MAG: hypothetical protein LQ342_007109 [Letrouitia transgressa]|nr:MAG: hypothetical protein LQ342_007109 [Letrouitia transgressa]